MKPAPIAELLKQCDTVEDVVTRIDALAARLLEAASGADRTPQPREVYALAGMRLRAAIPALLAVLGVRGA